MWPGNFEPTPTHRFLKLLDDRGVLLRCFTQNIDSRRRRLPPAQIVAAHGNFDGAHVAHRFDGGGDGGPVDVDALRDAIMTSEEGPGGWRAFNKAHGGLASRASPSSARRCRSGLATARGSTCRRPTSSS